MELRNVIFQSVWIFFYEGCLYDRGRLPIRRVPHTGNLMSEAFETNTLTKLHYCEENIPLIDLHNNQKPFYMMSNMYSIL